MGYGSRQSDLIIYLVKRLIDLNFKSFIRASGTKRRIKYLAERAWQPVRGFQLCQ